MDHLSNTLVAVQNAHQRAHTSVRVPFSSHVWNVLFVLYTEGYIAGFLREGHSLLIKLRYVDGLPVLRRARRVSRPGKRQYVGVHEIPYARQGLGTYIVATPYGILCDRDAVRLNTGGELLAYVI